MPYNLLDNGKLTAEIRRTFKHVVCGRSDNSVGDSINTFKIMFSDSKIASKIELGINKLNKYVINYGILGAALQGVQIFR